MQSRRSWIFLVLCAAASLGCHAAKQTFPGFGHKGPCGASLDPCCQPAPAPCHGYQHTCWWAWPEECRDTCNTPGTAPESMGTALKPTPAPPALMAAVPNTTMALQDTWGPPPGFEPRPATRPTPREPVPARSAASPNKPVRRREPVAETMSPQPVRVPDVAVVIEQMSYETPARARQQGNDLDIGEAALRLMQSDASLAK